MFINISIIAHAKLKFLENIWFLFTSLITTSKDGNEFINSTFNIQHSTFNIQHLSFIIQN